jgi:hypothetical protein
MSKKQDEQRKKYKAVMTRQREELVAEKKYYADKKWAQGPCGRFYVPKDVKKYNFIWG